VKELVLGEEFFKLSKRLFVLSLLDLFIVLVSLAVLVSLVVLVSLLVQFSFPF
jgi:hypothetical protein